MEEGNEEIESHYDNTDTDISIDKSSSDKPHHSQQQDDLLLSTPSHRKDLITLFYDKFHPLLPNYTFPCKVSPPESLDPLIHLLDEWFECSKLGSSPETEIFCGVIHFFSCMYCLPVIPQQMETANYDVDAAYAIICLVIGLGSIASGFLTNTPLIIAPPTAVSIFFTSSLQSSHLEPIDGNFAVTMSGVAMFFLGILGPLGSTITLFIPECIQASTTVGIGLLTALAGATEINLVVRGKYSLLELGTITNEILISFASLAILGMAITRHSRFAYLLSIGFGTFLWWSVENEWPDLHHLTSLPRFQSNQFHSASQLTVSLTFSLIFLNILTLFGLARALCDLASLTPPHPTPPPSGTRHSNSDGHTKHSNSDGQSTHSNSDEHTSGGTTAGTSIPRGRILILIIGLGNILSGICYGPPIILSPEAVGGIKAGAKTGLSAIIAGILFLFSIFWGPFFTKIPSAGTSPVLIVIGLFLFLNIHRINFKETKEGIPAFCCLFFISFTNSIICGLGIGYSMYVLLHIFTGDLYYHLKETAAGDMMIKRFFPAADERESEEENAEEEGTRGRGGEGEGGEGKEVEGEEVMNPVVVVQEKQSTDSNEENLSGEDTATAGATATGESRALEIPKMSQAKSVPTISLPTDRDDRYDDDAVGLEEGRLGHHQQRPSPRPPPSPSSSSPSSSPRRQPAGQEGKGSSGHSGRKKMRRHRSFQEVSIAIVKHMSEDINAESAINTPVMPE